MIIKNNQKGFSLVEVAVSAVLLAVLVMGFSSALRRGMVSRIHAKQMMDASRLTESIAARLQRTNFHDIFAVDSINKVGNPTYNSGLNKTRYLIQWSTSPIQGLLTQFESEILAAGFDRYSIDCTFVRRDSSDMFVDDAVFDSMAFYDNNNDKADDYDSQIRFNDANGDGDYFDVYVSTTDGRTVSETPDTHFKALDIYVWKKGMAYGRKHLLLSMAKFSGSEEQTSENAMGMNIRFPLAISAFRQRDTVAKRASLDLVTVYSGTTTKKNERVCNYPDPVEGASPLQITGVTSPNAQVEATFISYSAAGSGTVEISTALSGYSTGWFQINFPNLTPLFMQPGHHELHVRALRNGVYSSEGRSFVYVDGTPPIIVSSMVFPAPGAVVKTRTPYISFLPKDIYASAQPKEKTGIDWNTVALLVNGSTVPISKPTGAIPASLNDYPPEEPSVWMNVGTKLPPAALSDNTTYNVRAEASDRAGYKVAYDWSFVVDLGPDGFADSSDTTPPVVSSPSPPDGTAVVTKTPLISCVLTDDESGIAPQFIVLRVDGVDKVSAVVTPDLGNYFNNKTGVLSYTPGTALVSGSHTVEVVASHWSTNPVGNQSSTTTWTFTSP